LKIALELLGIKNLKVKIVQFVHIVNTLTQQTVKLSKRLGISFSLNKAVSNFGAETLRYFLTETPSNKKIELTTTALKDKSWKNPLFYLQYASVRLHQIFQKAVKQNLKPVVKNNYPLLKTELEKKLLLKIHFF
jgi:arginyl-tRNA synthetase